MSNSYIELKKKKCKNSNQFSKVCRGSSFSRSKNSFKLLTQPNKVDPFEGKYFIDLAQGDSYPT